MERMTGPTNREDLRVGTTEREAAIAALGEHLSAGRVTLDEYGTRSAEATTAATRGELMTLFSDLPSPHPQLDDPAPAVDLAKRPAAQVAVKRDRGELTKRVVAGVSAVSWLLWIPAVVWSHGTLWWLMFVPLAVSGFAGKVWGDDHQRDEHRERRSRRHGW
jgi:hypothetical protein